MRKYYRDEEREINEIPHIFARALPLSFPPCVWTPAFAIQAYMLLITGRLWAALLCCANTVCIFVILPTDGTETTMITVHVILRIADTERVFCSITCCIKLLPLC